MENCPACGRGLVSFRAKLVYSRLRLHGELLRWRLDEPGGRANWWSDFRAARRPDNDE